jgi:hypothetical protein
VIARPDAAARQAVIDLASAWCRFVDQNRPDDAAALVTENATACFVHGDDLHGRPAVAAYLARALSRYRATTHILSPPVITSFDEDRIESSTPLYAWHRSIADEPDFEVWGCYDDVITRVEGQWRFAERRLKIAGVRGREVDVVAPDRRSSVPDSAAG